MADPVLIPCPKEVWTPIAIGVTSGLVSKKSEKPSLYLSTYRMTGEAAPTLIDEGIKMFVNSDITVPISASAAIDVYVWTTEEAGVVRVDL